MKTEPLTREDRICRAAKEYQTALESGRRPDRRSFLAQYPDLADELAPYLDALDALGLFRPNSASNPVEESLPTIPLGDFQIVREIGRGGMGVVYEAQQLSLGRRVALKVLPFAAALDSRQLQRFKNEAQAAAQLHHTNIVPVYAVGCDRGVHFYAMQMIEGRTLAELIAEMSRAEQPRSAAGRDSADTIDFGPTRESLGRGEEFYRNVARLMVQAAEALEHAHGQGVIHRDVKPANLMLDVHGHLWVTDFGLAQFQAGLELTQTGDLLGTLRYMSPEQASGQRVLLDSRTDIYSLGVTFYELLAREPFFAAAPSRPDLLRQIAQEEPRALRSIHKSVPAELETIILKCVSKVPAERYSSARELADDLQRFLSFQPIRARRPNLVDRARKWLRRHPGFLMASGVLLLLCTIGLLVSHALVTHEKTLTSNALLRERIRAEHARQLVDRLIKVSEEELDDSPIWQGLRKQLLETAVSQYQKLIDESKDDPEATAEMSAAQKRVQQVLADLITLQGAETLLLLQIDSVLDELKPSDEQRRQLKALTDQLRRQRRFALATADLSPAERQSRRLEQIRETEEAAAKLLTEGQRLRLRQLALQRKGIFAFRDPEVVAVLQLSPGQRLRIRELDNDFFLVMGEGPPPRHDPKHRGGLGPRPEPREMLGRYLDLLTPEQKARWEEMRGEPIDFPPPRPPGPPPRKTTEEIR